MYARVNRNMGDDVIVVNELNRILLSSTTTTTKVIKMTAWTITVLLSLVRVNLRTSKVVKITLTHSVVYVRQ